MYLKFFIIFNIALFASCSKLIDDSFENYNPSIVLIGILEADSIISVHISTTANLSDELPKQIENALVVIKSKSIGSDTLFYATNGIYKSKHKALAGETYTCNVHVNGLVTVSAQTTVPKPTSIHTTNYTEKGFRDENGEIISSIDFEIMNDKSKKQFWEVELISVGQFGKSWNSDDFSKLYSHYIVFIAEQNQVLLNEASPLNLFSNAKIQDTSYNVKFYFNKNNLTRFYGKDRADSIFVVLKSVDETYYKYVKQHHIYLTGKEIKFGYTAKHFALYSNVENGYGIFTSYSSFWKRWVIETETETE